MENARDFSSRLLALLRDERKAAASFLVALATFDERRLWVQLGYSSLFHYLHRELGMSKGAAHYRKTAAELIQRVPAVVPPLEDGRLCITSIIELAKVLTPANQAEVLPRFFHCSRQEAKAVSAEISPAEAVPVRTVVTALPAAVAVARSAMVPAVRVPPVESVAPRPGAVQPVEPAATLPGFQADGGARRGGVRPLELEAPLFGFPQGGSAGPAADLAVQPVEPGASVAASRTVEAAPVRPAVRPAGLAPRVIEPLTAELCRVHVTVPKRLLEKLERARDALSHSHPDADDAAVLEEALDLLLERAAKRNGLVKRPRSKLPEPDGARGDGGELREGPGGEAAPRYVPAAVRREVWERDEGRCQWPTADGGICGSTCRLQFDHIVPVARGGKSTQSNIRLVCAFHNDLAARQVFGDAWMDRFSAPGRGRPPRAAGGGRPSARPLAPA